MGRRDWDAALVGKLKVSIADRLLLQKNERASLNVVDDPWNDKGSDRMCT